MRINRSAWLLAVLSGVLQILIFPLPNLYVLCWVAMAPLLVAVLRAQPADTLQLPDSRGARLVPANAGQGFLLGYVSGIIWYAGTCYWVYDTMHHYGGLAVPAALGVLIMFCLYLAIYHGAFGALVALAADPRSPVSRRALLTAPFLWVGLELAKTRISGFPWNLLGTVQVDNIPLARVASFTGVYGLSFEIVLVNTALAAAFLVRPEKRKPLLVAGLGAVLAVQAGRWIPAAVAADHTAYLVQQNIPVQEGSEWTKDYFEGTVRDLTWITLHPPSVPRQDTAEPPHPNLIVWPESPAPFYTVDPIFRQVVSNITRQSQTWMVTGAIGTRNASERPELATQVYNSAALVGPDGSWVARYDKVHLVPFGEYLPFPGLFSFAGGLTKAVGDFGRGTSRAPLNAGGARLGVFICYESVFPDEVRQFARDGAQVLVNISNDGWYGDSGAWAQHLAMSRMRAIENNRWLLLDANTGFTASVNPYGRVEASIPRKVRSTLVAPYALSDVTTFYTRHGDWFAYLCAIISVAALLTRLPLSKKTGQ